MTENRSLEAALKYAGWGYKCFPIRNKLPVTPAGFLDASDNEAMVKAWWEDHPEWGVGIRIPEWGCVLDLDTVGEKTIELHGLKVPSTACSKTRRGKHFIYELPEGLTKPPSRKIGHLPDVDLLVNGYICAPPSRHPSGGEYEWELEPAPKHVEIAPDWIVVALMEERAKKEGMTDEDFHKGLPVGQRQWGLFRRACRLRAKGNTKGEAKAILRDLAELSGSSDYDVSGLVDRVWRTYDEADSREDDDDVKVWDLSDMLAKNTEPPAYFVDKMLPAVGYTILSGAQGSGKSVLADQVAACVASGRSIFGRKTEQAGVLVIEAEHEASEAAQRWRGLLTALEQESAPAGLHVAFDWPPVGDGGLEKLGSFLADHPYVRLVVWDTLGDAWPASEGNSSNAYNREVSVMKQFIKFAREYGIAFLLVHHERKPQAGKEDQFSDRASGTRAIPGKAKARWSLQRKDFENQGTLEVGGKIPARQINLTFDTEMLVWR